MNRSRKLMASVISEARTKDIKLILNLALTLKCFRPDPGNIYASISLATSAYKKVSSRIFVSNEFDQAVNAEKCAQEMPFGLMLTLCNLTPVEDNLLSVALNLKYFQGYDCRDSEIRFLYKKLQHCSILNYLADLKTPGEFAYILGHIGCLLSFLGTNSEKLFLFDDDIMIRKDNLCPERFSDTIEYASNFDILFLGASQYNWDNLNEQNKDAYYTPNLHTYGTFAIVLTRAKAIQYLLGLLQFDSPADHKPIKRLFMNNDCRAGVCYPNIFIADVNRSIIRGKRNMHMHSKLMRWDPAQYQRLIPLSHHEGSAKNSSL